MGPTTKKQEVWQGGESHWNKEEVCEGACFIVVLMTVVNGGMKLVGAERRLSTAVGIATLEECQVLRIGHLHFLVRLTV
jgi:hypothetical protein